MELTLLSPLMDDLNLILGDGEESEAGVLLTDGAESE